MELISDPENIAICDIQAPCFQHLSEDEIDLIRSSKTQVSFRKGENLTKQGAFASYVLFISSGITKQFVEGDGSRNFNVKICNEGEFIGLSAVFGKNTFQYSVVALNDTRAFLIETEVVSKLVQGNGVFAFNFIKRFCEQNDTLFNSLQTLVYKQMNGRMADALIYLDSFNTNKDSIFTLLSRKDIADFAGISTESAVKILKSFEKDGILKLEEKNVLIIDREALTKISKIG